MIDGIESFFTSIAYQMETIPSYGIFHISYTLIGFFICIFLAWKLKNIKEDKAVILLFVIGILLLISEIGKQLFYYFVIEHRSYSWGDFPFHLCSIPMYLCIVLPFVKNKAIKNSMYSFMSLYNLLGGAISFAEPSGLFLNYYFLTIHALLWHMILVFVGFFVLLSKRGGQTLSDYIAATKLFLLLSCVAFGLNCFVQYGLKEHMNMFFVGPGNSPLAVFKQFSEWFGWYINTPIYLFAVCLGAFLVFFIHYYFQKRFDNSNYQQHN